MEKLCKILVNLTFPLSRSHRKLNFCTFLNRSPRKESSQFLWVKMTTLWHKIRFRYFSPFVWMTFGHPPPHTHTHTHTHTFCFGNLNKQLNKQSICLDLSLYGAHLTSSKGKQENERMDVHRSCFLRCLYLSSTEFTKWVSDSILLIECDTQGEM